MCLLILEKNKGTKEVEILFTLSFILISLSTFSKDL